MKSGRTYEPKSTGECSLKRNRQHQFMLMANASLTEALVESALRSHTCGTLVAFLAEFEQKLGNKKCVQALLNAIEDRGGIMYVKGEPGHPLANTGMCDQDVFTLEVPKNNA